MLNIQSVTISPKIPHNLIFFFSHAFRCPVYLNEAMKMIPKILNSLYSLFKLNPQTLFLFNTIKNTNLNHFQEHPVQLTERMNLHFHLNLNWIIFVTKLSLKSQSLNVCYYNSGRSEWNFHSRLCKKLAVGWLIWSMFNFITDQNKAFSWSPLFHFSPFDFIIYFTVLQIPHVFT